MPDSLELHTSLGNVTMLIRLNTEEERRDGGINNRRAMANTRGYVRLLRLAVALSDEELRDGDRGEGEVGGATKEVNLTNASS